MASCDPRTGERLPPEHGRTKIAAFGSTFSAPKSASVLVAIGDETARAPLAAHEKAVESAFSYLEREASFPRITVIEQDVSRAVPLPVARRPSHCVQRLLPPGVALAGEVA